MIKIEYPPYQPKIKPEQGREFIFDPFRKRWFLLTPEEWVRQNFLQYLVQVLHYPASLIAVEKELTLGEMKKRFDIVVYDKEGKPYMLIECKEMGVALTDAVLHQALRYNMNMQAGYLVITNGNNCVAYQHLQRGLVAINKLPSFQYQE